MNVELVSLVLIHFLCNTQGELGLMSPRDALFCSGNFEATKIEMVFVPLSTAREQIVGRSTVKTRSVGMITVKIADSDKIDEGIEEVRDILRFQHRLRAEQPDDFRISNIAEMLSLQEESSTAMTRLLAAIASISLIVGGIGIMNIMLVSVTERTREIGLRMAVGAGPTDIRRQFLAEAMLLSLGGGVLGIAIGIVGALLVGRFNADLPVQLNGQVIALAAGFSIATGLFFGYYPASKASQLDPIEALRQQ
jgi:putative ABC transport system permease protein